MYDVLIDISQIALPIFIFLTMANVGLTQDPATIVERWKNWPFYLKMLIANFLAAPALMWLLLSVWDLSPEYTAGMFVYSMCAGAPFLIKLTATAEHDIALGAATMMLLVIGTVVIVPSTLPTLVTGVSVDGGAMALLLTKQLLLPLVVGGVVAHFLPTFGKRIQPLVGTFGNVTLHVTLVSTIVGYLPKMMPIIRSGALVLGIIFICGAFGIGFLAGRGKDALEDIGALATAQRNTAATMLIAANSFSDPIVLVLVTVVNTLGIMTLITVAKALKRDNAKVVLI